MIRTALFYFTLGLSLIFSGISACIHTVLGWLKMTKLRKSHLNLVTKTWAKFMILMTGNRIIVEGREKVPSGPVLFVSNHQSYFDILVFMANVPYPAPFVAKIEMAKAPVMSYWMKQMGCLFMDRSSIRQSVKIIFKGIEMLKSGTSLVIFPEGTRSKKDEVGEFKAGSLKLAVKAGVPIVPVTLINTYKVYEADNRVKTSKVSMIFHDAIETKGLEKEEINSLHTRVKDIIVKPLETK